MPAKMALVDYGRCRPKTCGRCAAAAACTRKLMVQETAGSPPLTDPFLCRGCGDCVRACPLNAVFMSTQ